jgi:tetratricopeptide (TPR) repeat protein
MAKTVPRPIAFIVMPFRERQIPNPQKGTPKKVDFDALWDKAFRPVLKKLGYLAVRADIETGSVIIKDMLERLAFAELVLADMTLPNGNVYYEVGIRHVAKKTNCVLIAADWSKQLFDVDQMRSLRYPLKDGSVPKKAATAIRRVLLATLPSMKNSVTPYYELVSKKNTSSVFREQIETISAFQAAVRTARMERNPDMRKKRVIQLVEIHKGPCLELPEVAFELITLIRDNISWEEMIAFSKKLPEQLQKHAFIREQTLLARSMLGEHIEAITALEELIKLEGDTPERRGLVGGRYKRLWREAQENRKFLGQKIPDPIEQGYLENAIESYRQGMSLDLNEYYCASNLPGLLRERKSYGDEEEALFLDLFVKYATKRKIDRGEDDGWARSTLLGTAFRLSDVSEAVRLTKEVAQEGPSAWQLETTLQDIQHTLDVMPDSPHKHQLLQCYEQLTLLFRSFCKSSIDLPR